MGLESDDSGPSMSAVSTLIAGVPKPWFKQAAVWLRSRERQVMRSGEERHALRPKRLTVTGDHGAAETSDEEWMKKWSAINGSPSGSCHVEIRTTPVAPTDNEFAERCTRIEELLKRLQA